MLDDIASVTGGSMNGVLQPGMDDSWYAAAEYFERNNFRRRLHTTTNGLA